MAARSERRHTLPVQLTSFVGREAELAEVARLIGRGRTNREIAAALVIAEPTAERHVANIFNRLGVHSRAEVAAWIAVCGTDPN